MAKGRYVGGRRRKKGTNLSVGDMVKNTWICNVHADSVMQREAQLRGRREAEEKGGTKPKSELLPNYCKSSCSACSCPVNLSHRSFPWHICPLMLIWSPKQRSFLSPKKSGHTLPSGYRYAPVWWVDMSWNLKVCIPKKERSKVEITPGWCTQGEMEERGGSVNGKWPFAKWQSALPAVCLFYTHSSITNISLLRTDFSVCVCMRVYLQ